MSLARVASLSCCAHYCVMAAPVGLRSMGSGFCDSAALGGRPLPLEGMPCPFIVGAPWPLPLCVLNAFIWLALHYAIHVGAHGLTIEKVCMLVWPVGIGPHVCLVSNPSKCASCLCLAHGPGGRPARLHGRALLGTPVPSCCLAVYAICFSSGGDGTLSGASVVGTAYSRLPRA